MFWFSFSCSHIKLFLYSHALDIVYRFMKKVKKHKPVYFAITVKCKCILSQSYPSAENNEDLLVAVVILNLHFNDFKNILH